MRRRSELSSARRSNSRRPIAICSENPQVQAQTASYADLPWWQVFQDPQLQELIRTALKQNYDLQIATERINAARAQLAITRSSLFPQVQAERQFRRRKRILIPNEIQLLYSQCAMPRSSWTSSASCAAQTEAARAELLATEDARQTVILTLVSDVASDYFALLQLDLQLQITRRHRQHAGRLGEAH